jgi:tagaturonate reductase
VGVFLRQVLLNELVPTVSAEGAAFFAHHVLERFANPFIQHHLIDITLQQTTKLRVRVIPSLLDYAAQFGSAPPLLSVGFAAWLLYMRGDTHASERRADACAEKLEQMWRQIPELRALVRAVAADVELWQTDLRAIPLFVDQVGDTLELMLREGVPVAIEAQLAAGRA